MKFNFLLEVYITPFKKFLDLGYKNLVLKANLKWGFHLYVSNFLWLSPPSDSHSPTCLSFYSLILTISHYKIAISVVYMTVLLQQVSLAFFFLFLLSISVSSQCARSEVKPLTED
jgi:hypothetical protein